MSISSANVPPLLLPRGTLKPDSLSEPRAPAQGPCAAPAARPSPATRPRRTSICCILSANEVDVQRPKRRGLTGTPPFPPLPCREKKLAKGRRPFSPFMEALCSGQEIPRPPRPPLPFPPAAAAPVLPPHRPGPRRVRVENLRPFFSTMREANERVREARRWQGEERDAGRRGIRSCL